MDCRIKSGNDKYMPSKNHLSAARFAEKAPGETH
jgi:hypothetical protein